MKSLIGYRFWIKFDNGDYNEWFRETNIISPLYTTKDLANKSFHLFLDRKRKDIKHAWREHLRFQKQFEKDFETYKTRCIIECNKEIDETILKYRNKVSIVPIYINDSATESDDITKFNIAD